MRCVSSASCSGREGSASFQPLALAILLPRSTNHRMEHSRSNLVVVQFCPTLNAALLAHPRCNVVSRVTDAPGNAIGLCGEVVKVRVLAEAASQCCESTALGFLWLGLLHWLVVVANLHQSCHEAMARRVALANRQRAEGVKFVGIGKPEGDLAAAVMRFGPASELQFALERGLDVAHMRPASPTASATKPKIAQNCHVRMPIRRVPSTAAIAPPINQ